MYELIAVIFTGFMSILGASIGSSSNLDFSGAFAVMTMGFFILRSIKKSK